MAIDSEQILRLVRSAGRHVGVHEILKAGGLHPGQQTHLKRVLRELVKRGALIREGKRFGLPDVTPSQRSGPAWGGKRPVAVRREAHVREGARRERASRPPPRGKTVVGVIHQHRDGFAFVKPIVGETSEDLFIPPEEARKALDHDQVRVEVVPGRGGRTMGRIVEVTTRTRQLVVGVYRENARGAWVEPKEAELGRVRVPKTQLARPGDLVKVRLGVGQSMFLDEAGLTGEVAGSLGAESDHSVEVLSIAFAKGFHDEFPPEVMDEADGIPLEVSEAEAHSERRRDLRALPLVTIDGEDARDFDDAVYCEAKGDGWRLIVAIADVSHYVREGTAIDAEGLRRATSVYLPGRVLPMLPERLSNGICSLKPDVDRLCMVADLRIDANGQTTSAELYPAVMRSHARCTYTEVHRVLAGEDVPGRTELRPHFERLLALSKRLTAMRLARGAIDFDLPEYRVVLGEDGLPTGFLKRERWESHRLVEECMLAANEAVARFFREQELPTVNRYHGDPDEDRLEMFLRLLGAYGVEVPPGEFTSQSLNAVLKQLEGHPEQRALNQLALRSMMQAVYSSQRSGHYGLGADDYLHFTSPIRRYPDLLVHRLLKKLWGRGARRPSDEELEEEEGRLEELAVQCSERERAAMQVEREVNQLYSCLLVQDRVGETLPGTVAGLSESGFFVQLDELLVEGFVRGDDVYPDFEFDEATYRLTFGNGREVRVGQRCEVEIGGVSLERRQIDFVLRSLEGESDERAVARPARALREDGPGRPPRAGSREQRRGAPDARGGSPRRAARFGRDEPRRWREQAARSEARRRGERQEGWTATSTRRGGAREEPARGASRFGREERVRSGGRFGAQEARRGSAAAGGRGARPSGGRFSRDDERRESRPRQREERRVTSPGEGVSWRERQQRSGGGRFGRMEPRKSGTSFGGRQERRSPQPPPQPWDRPKEEPEEKEARSRFDARAVLDRLWQQRGGKGGGKR